jgi:uncharacterized membrane protein
MDNQPYTPEITSDDKLWALLAYVFAPLVPILIMLMEDKKNRPFLRAHYFQALVLGVINVIVGTFLSFTIILACLPVLIWAYLIYLGIQAYNGKYNTIPVITDFCKKQGWA